MIALDPRQDVGHRIGIHQADHARTNICDLKEVVCQRRVGSGPAGLHASAGLVSQVFCTKASQNSC